MYGVIDIGSNTIRLVLFEVKNDLLLPKLNKKASVGLVGYINKDNFMSEDGINKAIKTLKEFNEILSYFPVIEVYPFATASLRNIENSDEVVDRILQETGLSVRILSGDEEALFDYSGAIQSIQVDNGLLVDVGGGSSEVVLYKNKEVLFTYSLPIGSLNLYKKYVDEIMPTSKEIQVIQEDVLSRIKKLKLCRNDVKGLPLVVVGGTGRALFKVINVDKELRGIKQSYDTKHLENVLSNAKNKPFKLADQILKNSPERIHTFVPGLIVFNTIVDYFKLEQVYTSKYGVREGFLCQMINRGRTETCQ